MACHGSSEILSSASIGSRIQTETYRMNKINRFSHPVYSVHPFYGGDESGLVMRGEV